MVLAQKQIIADEAPEEAPESTPAARSVVLDETAEYGERLRQLPRTDIDLDSMQPSLLDQSLVAPDATMHEVIERFSANLTQAGLVVDERQRLLGTISDGDVRRAILAGKPMTVTAREIMNTSPRVLKFGQDRSNLLATMQREKIRYAPIVDFAGRVVDLVTIDSLLRPEARPNWVVLMAGGEGKRMRPLTETTPKPMLSVGGRPILETIVRSMASSGFTNFFLAVNYQAKVIKDHFGNGAELGVRIRYLEEEQPLGTAGPLGLLPAAAADPIVVMNADVLTKVDLGDMLSYHIRNGGAATMAVREYEVQVPYGVVEIENKKIVGMREKPLQRYHINTGIYVLEPSVLPQIRPGVEVDMPNLFDRLRMTGSKTLAYPVSDYWCDIGQMDDYHRANADFQELF